MSAEATESNIPVSSPRWRLWIDGCGGFLLLGGTRWTVGGPSQRPLVDVCVRADWPREAGTIVRRDGDYFWVHRSTRESQLKEDLMLSGRSLPVAGSATVNFHRSSPLCESAVLKIKPPHRFDDHVDAVVLLADSILIGATQDCHIRSADASDRIVLTLRNGRLQVKKGRGGEFQPLIAGNRVVVESIAMTLEEV